MTSIVGKSVPAGSPIGWCGPQRPPTAVYPAVPVLRRSQTDTVHVAGTFGCYPPQSRGNGDIVLWNVIWGKWMIMDTTRCHAPNSRIDITLLNRCVINMNVRRYEICEKKNFFSIDSARISLRSIAFYAVNQWDVSVS